MAVEVEDTSRVTLHKYIVPGEIVSVGELRPMQLGVAVDGTLQGHLLLGFLNPGYYVDLKNGEYHTHSDSNYVSKVRMLRASSAVTLIVK